MLKIWIAAVLLGLLSVGTVRAEPVDEHGNPLPPSAICLTTPPSQVNYFDHGPTGFTDNDGNYVPYITIGFDITCDEHVVNVTLSLPNGRPVETCNECLATWYRMRESIEFGIREAQRRSAEEAQSR